MIERRLREIVPARSMSLQSRAIRQDVRVSAIRAWREQPLRSDQTSLFGDHQMHRSLRKERALCGQSGYDLNRHIRLLKQQKNASQRKAF
jgi:uncharacterized Rmd1/YagE family protein